ncbi:hypothetical protein TNCV_287181 [Trichonephila clavipes]|nr:hypothetical protein TNCV_287181 [Trichonephila clavipes]
MFQQLCKALGKRGEIEHLQVLTNLNERVNVISLSFWLMSLRSSRFIVVVVIPVLLNGYVNKQNCRIWSEANPQVYVETPLHPEKLTVWCALWAGGILLQK